jgi:hypothetical protein
VEVADQFDELIDLYRLDRDGFFDRSTHFAFKVLHGYSQVHLHTAYNARAGLYDRLDPQQALLGQCIKPRKRR